MRQFFFYLVMAGVFLLAVLTPSAMGQRQEWVTQVTSPPSFHADIRFLLHEGKVYYTATYALHDAGPQGQTPGVVIGRFDQSTGQYLPEDWQTPIGKPTRSGPIAIKGDTLLVCVREDDANNNYMAAMYAVHKNTGRILTVAYPPAHDADDPDLMVTQDNVTYYVVGTSRRYIDPNRGWVRDLIVWKFNAVRFAFEGMYRYRGVDWGSTPTGVAIAPNGTVAVSATVGKQFGTEGAAVFLDKNLNLVREDRGRKDATAVVYGGGAFYAVFVYHFNGDKLHLKKYDVLGNDVVLRNYHHGNREWDGDPNLVWSTNRLHLVYRRDVKGSPRISETIFTSQLAAVDSSSEFTSAGPIGWVGVDSTGGTYTATYEGSGLSTVVRRDPNARFLWRTQQFGGSVVDGATDMRSDVYVGTVYTVSDRGAVCEIRKFRTITTIVSDNAPATPTTFELAQNYPNPFNPETEIRFQILHAGRVEVTVFNLLGAEVRTLVDEERAVGWHSVRWDGKDKDGKPVASGVYLYQLRAGNFAETKRMVLMR